MRHPHSPTHQRRRQSLMTKAMSYPSLPQSPSLNPSRMTSQQVDQALGQAAYDAYRMPDRRAISGQR